MLRDDTVLLRGGTRPHRQCQKSVLRGEDTLVERTITCNNTEPNTEYRTPVVNAIRGLLYTVRLNRMHVQRMGSEGQKTYKSILVSSVCMCVCARVCVCAQQHVLYGPFTQRIHRWCVNKHEGMLIISVLCVSLRMCGQSH